MTGTPAGAATLRWVTMLAWLLPPLVELPLVAALSSGVPQIGRAAVFGVPATRAVVLFALAAALAGVVAVLRGTTGVARAAVAGALSIAAGTVAALAAGFLFDSTFPLLGVLPAHSALALAVLAGATLREPTAD
ncbi:hypothetical protein GCM10020358_43590 [Amorphoplanes nipponensis]|uniref:Uncharacterized protein n=1 Tax=Actinoplanes nipponensis TaxID=135950 RepID=A0A919JMG0_9ACTN|nr:hypothetical protein [Actinoplanes nipponensis]GIE53744.1 hypothetical protein Ani05nite_72780 [Actinoplanes nipponensis]